MEIVQFKSSEGINFKFHVRKDMTEPCSCCGIPACGREDILWYENQGKRITIIYDGSDLDLTIGDFLTKNNNQIAYQKLPNFIKENNEASGWTDCDDYHGYNLDFDDFLTALELLLTLNILGEWMTKEAIEAMKQLAFEAKEKNSILKITRR